MKHSLLWRLLGVAVIACGLGGISVWFAHGRGSVRSDKLPVVATFYPMGEFARAVGGQAVSVSTLVRPGMEPHDYDPSAKDIAGIYRSKVFIYNGAGLEPWAAKLSDSLAAQHIVSIEASRGLHLRAADAHDTENASPTDPHVWLDPVLAARQVMTIQDGLIAADPAHRASYEANAKAYIAQLRNVDSDFRSGLASCSSRAIVTSHQAFGYLAAEYGLQVVSIAGISPDSEPSPQKLAEVAAYTKQHAIHYIFFETLASPKLSETIARETGAQAIVFNPLEGLTPAEVKAGKNYIRVQKDNLRALRIALDCK